MKKVNARGRKKIPSAAYKFLIVETRGLCSICHESSIEEIHHIIPVTELGTNNYENLIPLCASCHKKVHKNKISPKELQKLKYSWVSENEKILTRIILNQENLHLMAKEIASNYFRLKNVKEFKLFKDRLRNIFSVGEVFNNFARIKEHLIRKVVDINGNCWTYEHIKFYPLRTARYRVLHFRGDGPTQRAENEIQAKIYCDKKRLKSDISIIYDSPNFKSYKISWEKRVNHENLMELQCRYYWKNTWNLKEDFYSYDVLAWIDDFKYEFILPKEVIINTVSSSFIDLFGQEWPLYGQEHVHKNRFIWEGKRLPLFSTAVLKYQTRY